jgi:hypothetical protein
MASYVVVAPCAYVQDGTVVRLRRPGTVVELDEATAAQLGDAVTPQGQPAPATVIPEPAPPQPVAEPESAPAPEPSAAPAPTPEEPNNAGG